MENAPPRPKFQRMSVFATIAAPSVAVTLRCQLTVLRRNKTLISCDGISSMAKQPYSSTTSPGISWFTPFANICSRTTDAEFTTLALKSVAITRPIIANTTTMRFTTCTLRPPSRSPNTWKRDWAAPTAKPYEPLNLRCCRCCPDLATTDNLSAKG